MLLFMCINICLGLVNIPGSPISISESSCYYPEYGTDESGNQVDRPGFDPISSDGILYYMNGTAYVKTTDELGRELLYPTNSTQVAPGVWEGAGEFFNPITEPIERQYKSLETMGNMLTGGYIIGLLNHVHIDCVMDNDKTSPTFGKLVRQSTGYCTTFAANSTQPIYNNGISSADCISSNGIWAGDDANVMWDYLKGGLQSVIGFLIALTIFYWITGRGHILSS